MRIFDTLACSFLSSMHIIIVLSCRYDKEGVIGCILADHAGLCLGGNINQRRN